MTRRLNRSPEDNGGGGAKGGDDKGKTFTQEEVDRIIGDRLSRTKSQFADYDELKKFKEEHAKEQDSLKQAELVRQKKYEEAEGSYKKTIAEREAALAAKDARILDMTVTQAISSEATRQNGFIDETIALVKGMTVVTQDGRVVMKGKDTNGIDKEMSVEEGLKSFYANRPHLVKASGQGGSGTAPAGGAGNGNGGADLNTLNNQYYQAMQSGNRKLAAELKVKMAPLMKGNRNAM